MAQDNHGGPEGDARFAAVVERYGRFLRQAIVKLCPRDLGLQYDDVEQEARLRLWTALRSERPIQDLASYIYRVAANATIDAIRRLKARRESQWGDEEAEAGSEPAGSRREPADETRAIERRLLLEKVEGVVARLEERRRRVLRLHLQGFTTAEMGTLMGCTEPAARNLLHRALKELRERLEEEGIAYAGE